MREGRCRLEGEKVKAEPSWRSGITERTALADNVYFAGRVEIVLLVRNEIAGLRPVWIELVFDLHECSSCSTLFNAAHCFVAHAPKHDRTVAPVSFYHVTVFVGLIGKKKK